MLSVYSPDAEEILDAGIIKSASRPANLRPDAEGILDAGIIKSASRPANPHPGVRPADQVRVLQTKTYENSLGTWTQAPDS